MSNRSNITREELVAIAYELYSSLCIAFDKPYIDSQSFEANCKGSFKNFSNDSEKE